MAYPLRMAVPPWPSLRCARKRPPTRPKLPIVAVSSIFLIILPITTCRQKRSLPGTAGSAGRTIVFGLPCRSTKPCWRSVPRRTSAGPDGSSRI